MLSTITTISESQDLFQPVWSLTVPPVPGTLPYFWTGMLPSLTPLYLIHLLDPVKLINENFL